MSCSSPATDATLDELEAVEEKARAGQDPAKYVDMKWVSGPLLNAPLLRQLVVYLAIELRNKGLVKIIVAQFPPTSHAEILFGHLELDPQSRYGTYPELILATSDPAQRPTRGATAGLDDNCSDLVVAFVQAG
jgi:hypothetical protein